MKVVTLLSQIDEAKCVGDRICERICPAGAVKVVEKKAVVDAGRCVACGKCLDVCREDAVSMRPRSQPLLLTVKPEEADREKIEEICFKAHCLPTQVICACTGTRALEVAAALIKGAKSPEDLVLMTGVGSGCGIYCMGYVFRLFRAAGVKIPEDPRWHDLPLSLWDIPEEIAEKYPGHFLKEDREALSGQP